MQNGRFRSLVSHGLPCLAKLNSICVNFPEHGKRGVHNSEVTTIPREIFATSLTTHLLDRLSVLDVQLHDFPHLDFTETAKFSALRFMKILLYPLDTPEYRVLEPYVHMRSDFEAALRLPGLLKMTPNLVTLIISFNRKQRVMREVVWDKVCLPHLETIRLDSMDISEASLQALLLPSASTLLKAELDNLFLTHGSWASFYRACHSLVEFLDISGLHGRRYCDDRSTYSQEDAASWRDLFAEIERRREMANMPSMRALIKTASMEYFHDFGDMEHSFAF